LLIITFQKQIKQTWNIRSFHGASSLIAVSRELSRYGIDIVRVQGVRWEGSGTAPAGKYTFVYGKANETMNCVQGFLYTRETYQHLG
jgi:hypothetical protein